jgi:Flp pilus assembly protein TadD
MHLTHNAGTPTGRSLKVRVLSWAPEADTGGSSCAMWSVSAIAYASSNREVASVERILDVIRRRLGRASHRGGGAILHEDIQRKIAEPAALRSAENAPAVLDGPARASSEASVSGVGSPSVASPDDCASLRNAARSNIRAGRFGRAQRELERALEVDPTCGAGEDLRTLRAIRRCRRQLATQPSNPTPHIELGRSYLELDLASEALAELKEAARLAPQTPEPHIIMAIEHLYSSRPAEAEEEYERATAVDQSLPPFASLVETLRAEQLACIDSPG